MTASNMCSGYNVELSDPLYRSEEFMMFCYKILPCKKTFRHDWRVCPFAHGDETAKRRDPRVCKYTGVICPDAKKGRSCPRGDDCPCTHSLFEYWLHPTRFKTEICSRGARCNRPFCFFAHKQSEIRKPNFRVQMQGITCEPMLDHQHPAINSLSASTKRGPRQDTQSHPSLFPSTAAMPSTNLEGSVMSLPESGDSSCDAETSTGTWNSLMGGTSPRPEYSMKHLSGTDNGLMPQRTIPSTSMCPVLPQIPTSEHNAIDWSIWRPSVTKQKGSLTNLPIGFETAWNRPRVGNTVGISPRFMETRTVPGSLKQPFSKASENGYDRNYLLATIRDVYQSMLSGCCSGDQQSITMPTSECRAEQPQRHASFGLTESAMGGFYGSSGTCGLEGLQQNGPVSSNGLSYCPTNDPNTLERIVYALLKTDSTLASRYFK